MKFNKINKYLMVRYRTSNFDCRGIHIVRHFKLPPHRLPELYDYPGIGAFGPALIRSPARRKGWYWYAKATTLMGSPQYFFVYRGIRRCVKYRTLRKGKQYPIRRRLHVAQ